MIRLALIGIGGYGWGLGEWICRMSSAARCRLVAAADSRMKDLPQRAQQLRQAGVELFDDALAMFEALRGRCEAVYIATGISSHLPLTLAAVRAGFHVHLEKPPAATIQEVDEMTHAVEAAGRMCLVGFQAIHSLDVRFVKDRIVAGRLGRVRSIVCHAGWPRKASYYARNEWAGRLKCGGWVLDGPATNALAHQVANMLLWASARADGFAQPTAVRGELYAAGPIESHDTAAIEIQTDEGPRAVLLVSHCTDGQFGPVIEIDAERGRVRWEMNRGAIVRYDDGTEETCPSDDEQHGRMIVNFVEAIRQGRAASLRCDLRAARTMVLAANGAHESSGRIHRIEPPFARRVDDSTSEARTIVDGLDEMLALAAQRRGLFSDLPKPPAWAVRTAAYDLGGYSSFPQRFSQPC